MRKLVRDQGVRRFDLEFCSTLDRPLTDDSRRRAFRATANTGASPEDVMEALLHVAIYAGVPRANHAIKIARQTYEDMGVEL